VILLVTLFVGTFWQGAFYRPGQLAVSAGVAVAVAASVAARRPRVRELAAAPLPAVLALAGWIVLDTAGRGAGAAGAGGAVLALGVIAVVVVVRRVPAEDRELLLAAGLPVIGTLLAMTAWLGLVLHVPRWSLLAQGVWRGAGALTYPNATAGVLVMLALLTLARCARPSSSDGEVDDRTASPLAQPRAMRLTVMVMLLGAGTTMSRGGLLALAFGLVVALVLGGAALAQAVPGPLAGAVVGLAGALPATTSEGAAVVLVAAIAAVAGAVACELVTYVVATGEAVGTATTGGAARRRPLLRHGLHFRSGRGRRGPAVVGILLVVGAIGAGLVIAPPRWGVVAAARLTITSTHRADATRAALAEVRDHLVAGVGPGDSSVTWRRADGAVLTERYVHNEYLQVLLEYGAVGAGLLLVVLGSALVAVARVGWRTEATAAAGAAAITAFVVHSALDFLWHLPIMPLLAATVLAVTLLPAMPPGVTRTPFPAAVPRPGAPLEKVRGLP
jgi:hypothetical protein